MLPDIIFQIFTITADLVIFIFVGYYLYALREKQKQIEKRESKIDTNYHEIVDNALTKERKILDDTVSEAEKILSDAEFIKKSSKEAIDTALQELVKHIQKESIDTASVFMTSYSNSLKSLTASTLTDFDNISKGLEGDLQKQIKEFRENLLPDMERELEEYKKVRLNQSEEIIQKIIQKASQEIFNKSISIEDHHKLLTDALDKAKAEGAFS
jgi:hypothetical protein